MEGKKAAPLLEGDATGASDEKEVGYSIRVVASRTGIPVDTLRIWERRYGFPKPARRPGGGRLYSSQDVARLILLARARDAGYRPGDLIPLPDHDVIKLVEEADAKRETAAPPPLVPSPESSATVDDIVEMVRLDDVAGARAALRALAITLGPTRFVVDIAHPLAVRVGQAWEKGEIDVRHEHLASALLSMQLRLMLATFEDDHVTQGSDRPPIIVLTTLPGEAHALGLEMVALYLASHHRLVPRMLGADTPPSEIVEAARGLHADVIGISVSTAHDASVTKRYVDELRLALDPNGEENSARDRGMGAKPPSDRTPIKLWMGGAGAPFVAEPSDQVTLTTSWKAIDDAVAALR